MRLLAIVEVDQEDRIQCQQPGCGHAVYKRIHVVEEDQGVLVLGSTCFAKRYGDAEDHENAKFGSGDGRKLTTAERDLLQNNTAALIAQFDLERVQQLEASRTKHAALQEQFAKREVQRRNAWAANHGICKVVAMPWRWAKPLSSIALFNLNDNTQWVRVQHADGRHLLMPWPLFEGWDETMPASIGTPDQEIGGYLIANVISTVAYLRARSLWDKVGSWRDVMGGTSLEVRVS
jgi:hypothetical protein